MVEFLGMLKVRIVRGIGLAVRDLLSSDPYVVVTLGHQVFSLCSYLSPSVYVILCCEIVMTSLSNDQNIHPIEGQLSIYGC
jgi:hypothetical protein